MGKIELRTILINVKRKLHRIQMTDRTQTHICVCTLVACLKAKVYKTDRHLDKTAEKRTKE